jgi:beta-mannosidase
VLVIDGLDCVAEVTLNGTVVLRADNAFRTWRVDVSAAARKGENSIEVRFLSAVAEAAKRQAAQPFPVPYHAGNCPIPNPNMLRKPQMDFGWDWNIALAPFGIWNAIRLEPVAAFRISGLLVNQRHAPGRVSVEVTVLTEGDAPAECQATLCGVTAGGPGKLTLDIADPDLWWPAGQGAQVLHDLTVRVGDVVETRRIGLRSVELVTDPDAAGTGFKFRVNGRDVFMKGANWIPADALSGRITLQGVRGLLQSAALANMNMLRVWGGGRYEPSWFYDLCDELGLMVWQDFMFACALYPSTPEFLAEIDAEVRETVTRLNHHASLALWCGDNELLGALTWFEESRTNRDRYLVAYDRLNRTVEQALKAVTPWANWWPSSPSPGLMSFGDAWHDDRSGDMHFWSVWHEGRDFDHYRDVSPRFCSEFGFQSYPSLSAIRRFADPQDWNIAAPVFESHQKNAGGNARIAETMFRYFRWPERFEDFVYLSQVQQGLAIKTAVTHWRSLQPHCMGTLYWQLNDTWPVCSWSSLDHGGNWKLLHHMAAQFFAPVTVAVVPSPEGLRLVAISDGPQPVDLTIDVYACDMAGNFRNLGEQAVTVAPVCTACVQVVHPDHIRDDEILAVTWRSNGARGGDIFAPRPWKSYDLQDPQIALTAAADGDSWTLTLAAQKAAFFVAIEADLPGRFSLNAFALFPGYPAEVKFTPEVPGTQPTFTVRDLYSATYRRPA